MIYHKNFNNGQVQPAFLPMPDRAPSYKKENPLDKQSGGMNIGVTPGAVVGAVVGGVAAKKGTERVLAEQAMMAHQAETNKVSVSGNYYDQVQSVINNLSVVFTPISVIYMVNNKGNNFTLDTVEVSEMNDHMKMGFRQKDEEYFKDIMSSKMLSEMQLAEQEFARRLLKKQMATRDMITKQASDLSDVDTMLFTDIISDFAKLANMFSGSDELDKIASAIVDDVASEIPSMSICTYLDRPFDKYAGVITGIKSTLGLATEQDKLNQLKEHMSNPSYVIKHINVGFFPDRVVFSVGNQLISTLLLSEMNDEGYEKFLSQDQKYFRNFFADTIKESMAVKPKVAFVKTASEEIPTYGSAQDCLKTSASHPVLIYLILTERFGLEWLEYDISAIEEIIKSEFEIDDFAEANKNKVMTIMMANQSQTPFINAYGFEKAVLSLCGKPVDFMAKEKEFINPQDIIFAIDVLDRVTPYDDIYDNFSIEVFNFMADVLSEKGMYIYRPTNIIMSELEPVFTDRLNQFLIEAVKRKMTQHSTEPLLDDEIKQRCEYVADNAFIALKNTRNIFIEKKPSFDDRAGVIQGVIEQCRLDKSLELMITRQVVRNLALDDMLFMFEEELQNQLQNYSITMPQEGGDVIE